MSYCVIVLMLFKFIFYDFIITFYWIYMFICYFCAQNNNKWIYLQ